MSTPHPRDRALEHLLRRRTPAASAETAACADPETLAAWVEGGLDAQAMAQTELHLADCARCQAMLAAIVRSQPEAPAAEPWWSRVHLRWLVPLTAAAAATVLWMIVPGTGPDVPMGRPETTQARAERSDSADAPGPLPEQSRSAAITEPSTPAPTPSAAAVKPAPPTPAAKEAGEAVPSAEPGRAETSAADQAQVGATARDRARETAPAERKALAKQQSAEDATRSNEGRRQPEAPAESVTVTAAAPAADAPQAAKAAPPPAPAARGAGALAGFAETSAAFPSRDGVARWRLAAPGPADAGARRRVDGSVERSDDGGATWRPVPTGIRRPFTAGFATSATVCWLVGPGGTVALTTDGRTWRQVAVPAPDADLTSVEASDARTATVRDTQGRTFRTTDGGATWTTVP